MANTTLGNAFLLRRDLKQELGALESSLAPLMYHREDQPAPEENFKESFEKLTKLRNLLTAFDIVISEANNNPNTVAFIDSEMSLNSARFLKVNLSANLNTTQYLLRAALQVKGKSVSEIFVDTTTIPYSQYPKKYSYTMIADTNYLKELATKLSKQIRELDGQIQKTDWSLEVIIPEM